MLHKRAKKASGGVGILVTNYLLGYFRIQLVDKSMDNIVGVHLEHRKLQYILVIFSCYLPPEGSTRGRDSVTFFTHLLAQVYSLEADAIYLCGDFNSRISNKDDCIGDIDNVPPRVAIDLSMNSHGESVLEFLRDCKCCVLNGRINPDTDNFTSISSRGRAVVDYIITPHDCLETCIDLKVITPSEILSNNPICIDLIGEKSRLPDHSLLMFKFKINAAIEFCSSENDSGINLFKRRPRIFPDNFLSSNMCRMALLELMGNLEGRVITQSNIDNWYGLFCDIMDREMNKNLSRKSLSGQGGIHFKVGRNKPYWNAELKKLLNDKKQAEREIFEK